MQKSTREEDGFSSKLARQGKAKTMRSQEEETLEERAKAQENGNVDGVKLTSLAKVEEKVESTESDMGNERVPCPSLMSWDDWLWLTRWSFNEEQIDCYSRLSGEVLNNLGFTYPGEDEGVIVWEDDVWNLKGIQHVPHCS